MLPAPSEMEERVKDAIVSAARDLGVWFSGAEYVARAAIAAMREPTQEMIHAGFNTGVHDEEVIWNAMIDAARAEKETVAK